MLSGATPRRDFELSVVLVDEEEIRGMNRGYLAKDEVTDVLSFPQLTSGELSKPAPAHSGAVEPLGDIAICLPVASRQALRRGVSVSDEVELLAAHGLLHLLGYDDESVEDAARMREAEKLLVGRTIIGD